MAFLRRNLIAIYVVVAVGIGVFVTLSESSKADKILRNDGIASCVRENTRAALIVAFQTDVAESREKNNLPGADEAAANYRAYAHGLSLRLALPNGNVPVERLAEVQRVIVGGKVAFVLSPDAKKLVQLGCAQAYHDHATR